jgi:hypothetical protein
MIGECNYGGRVTDNADTRVLNALLKDFLGDHVLVMGYSAVPGETKSGDAYVLPQGNKSYDSYLEKITNMP